jgi:hypothetical protein
VARQVPLQGSAIVLDGGAAPAPDQPAARADAVPSHFIAAFGRRAGELAPGAAVAQADLAEQRRWERTREANLAFYEDRIRWAQREFSEWRDYINELEGELGREPTKTPLDFP